MRARVAGDELLERAVDLFDERLRQTAGRHDAERVAIEAGVVGRDPALLARDAGSTIARRSRRSTSSSAAASTPASTRSCASAARQVADAAQDVAERVARAGARAVRAVLEVGLDLVQRAGVDQLAQLVLAEQLAQQVAVERQRRRAPLGVRRVALVHVRRDVVEQQRRGERRGGGGLDLDHGQLAPVELRQQLLQARHVEHVAQALAVGLEDDREVGVALGDLEQRLRLEPLLPERRAAAGVGARDQQRARGVLAEARAEQRARAELGDDLVLDRLRVEQHEVRARRLVRVGQVDDDPLVRPDRVGLEPELVTQPRAERQAPRGMDAAAVGREHAQAPVADLVAEALDDDGAVGRDDARRVLLLAQVVEQVARRQLVEVVVGASFAGSISSAVRASAPISGLQLLRAADAVAVPGTGSRRRGPVSMARRQHGPPKELGIGIGALARTALEMKPAELAPTTTSTNSRRATCSNTCASSRTRRASSRRTARSSSSASATRSATGGCACSRPTAAAFTPRGASRSARGCATSSGWSPTRSGRTRGSSSTCPTRTSRRAQTSCCSTPTRSRTRSSPSSARARCSAPASARTPRERC